MQLDNDRIINICNLYTDECLSNLQKKIELLINDNVYKMNKIE